tara:strand:- start:171 stop:743 length:573 start_codon:yes stop_codon:yes gene_type:complete
MNTFLAPKRTTDGDLIVRCYRIEDAQQLMAATYDSYHHLKRFMPWATTSQSLEETQDLIVGFSDAYDANQDFVFSIWDADETHLLGGSGFHLREGPLKSQSAEIGLWINKIHAGRGLGRKALKAIIKWGFTDWPWLRLAWRCNAENIASIRCAESNDMIREGTLRHQYNPVDGSRRETACYSILKHEWTG